MKYQIGWYVEYQPHNGNQPRGGSKNVVIKSIPKEGMYEIITGFRNGAQTTKVVPEKHILGRNGA